MGLFLWEGLLGNLGAVGNSEFAIAIEEFDPYNTHYIYEILLSVDLRYKQKGIGKLYEFMFKEICPELLEYPFNQPDTLMERSASLLQQAALYSHLQRFRYLFDRFKFVEMKNHENGEFAIEW